MDLIVLCIIPDEPALEVVKKLSKDLSSQLGSKKALSLPPHLTLVGRFYTKNYAELLKQLKKTCSKFKPFSIDFETMDFFKEPSVVLLKPKMQETLRSLHDDLLDLVQKFREPWTRDALKIDTPIEKQQEYIKNYGSPYVKEYYGPHITLAGPDVNEKFKEISALLSKNVTIASMIKKVVILKKVDEAWIIDNQVNLGE